MRINFDKNTKAIILLMIAFVFIAIAVAYGYYRAQNKKVDPRIVPARELYAQYNALASEGNYEKIFQLLDSVQAIYSGIPHYKNSYEIGVLENNKAAAYLTMALYRDSIFTGHFLSNITKDSLFLLAEKSIQNSINNYNSWLNIYDSLDEVQVKAKIEDVFLQGLGNYPNKHQQVYLNQRVKDIMAAQYECKRRLSVGYTNLGIVYRHCQFYADAVECYKRALGLWDKNLTAQNNLNKLLDLPLEKRNVIQRMFPPDKEE